MKTIATMAAVAAVLLFQVAPAFAEGAIAVDDERGLSAEQAGYGVGWGGNRAEAEEDALRQCQGAGNDSCKVMVWFETCGAYVGSRTHYGIGWGASKKAAETMALDGCKNCRIVVSDCE
jgi:hypothetical protein